MALDIWDITSGTVVQHGPVTGSIAVEQTVGTPVALYDTNSWSPPGTVWMPGNTPSSLAWPARNARAQSEVPRRADNSVSDLHELLCGRQYVLGDEQHQQYRRALARRRPPPSVSGNATTDLRHATHP